eukprot:6011258-Amphidinium_carterae.1
MVVRKSSRARLAELTPSSKFCLRCLIRIKRIPNVGLPAGASLSLLLLLSTQHPVVKASVLPGMPAHAVVPAAPAHQPAGHGLSSTPRFPLVQQVVLSHSCTLERSASSTAISSSSTSASRRRPLAIDVVHFPVLAASLPCRRSQPE